jgi:hypothetical protein
MFGPDLPLGALRQEPVVVVALVGHEFLHLGLAAHLH